VCYCDAVHVGVMGAGSVGCYVGGRLLAGGAADVTFIGRERLRDEIAASGLTVKDFAGEAIVAPERVCYETELRALGECDAVLVCVKSAQTEAVGRALDGVIGRGTIVASLQNGVRNAPTLRATLPGRTVLAAIVGFNVVSRGGGVFHLAMSGPLSIERNQAPNARALVAALRAARLPVEELDDIAPAQWTKLLVNLNNAVSALSGAPTRELLLSPGYRRIVAAVIEEAVGVLRTASIRPARLRGVPVGIMPRVLRMPTPLVRLVTRAQVQVDPNARSSMWEDLDRRRATEVDYLNGEIVRLAEAAGGDAPINRRIVELVREAERAAVGSPGLDAGTLAAKLRIQTPPSTQGRGKS
jgi:2-dehydropantoate 2-reductase